MEDDDWTDVAHDQNCSVIGMIDMDAFELQIYLKYKFGEDKGREIYLNEPCILRHPTTSRVITANYIAKKEFGISRDEAVERALEKCPNLRVIRKDYRTIAGIVNGTTENQIQKAETELLHRSATQILDCFQDWRDQQTIRAIIKHVPSDETYFDLTAEVNKRIKDAKEYPVNGQTIGRNSHLEGNKKYKERSILFRYHVIHKRNRKKYATEARLIVGATILEGFRTYLFDQLGLEASGGIGVNPLQAKLACPLHKPGGMTILTETGIPRVSKRIPVEKIPSLGGQKGNRICQSFGYGLTMYDLSRIPLNVLQKRTALGREECTRIHGLSEGISYEKLEEKILKDSLTVGISNLQAINVWTSNGEIVRNIFRELTSELLGKLVVEEHRNDRKINALKIEIELNPRGHNARYKFPCGRFTLNSFQFLDVMSNPRTITQRELESIVNIMMHEYVSIIADYPIARVMKVKFFVPSFSDY